MSNSIGKHCSHNASTIRHLKEHEKSVHDRVQYPFKHCSYKPITNGSLAKHHKEVHVWIKYLCKHCSYKATLKGSLKERQKSLYEVNLNMKETNILANSKAFKQLKTDILELLILIIKEILRQIDYMEDSSSLYRQ